MVTRKPLPADSGLAPYPVTPISTNEPLPFRVGDARNQMQTDSPSDSEKAWGGEADNRKAGAGLPESLRVGPPGYTPNSSQEMLRPAAANVTNPYLKKQNSGSSNGNESSAEAWGGFEERRVQQTTNTAPTQQFDNLSVSDSNTNPWQPGLNGKETANTTNQPLPFIQREDSGNNARAAPPVPPVDTSQPVLVDIDEPESPAWDEDEPSPVLHEMPADNSKALQQMSEDRHAWDEQSNPLGQHPVSNTLVPAESNQQGEGWNLVDHVSSPDPGYEPIPRPFPEQIPVGAQESGIIGGDGHIVDSHVEEQAPALPPRRSQEQPPPQPPRPVIDTNTTGGSTSSLTSPTARRQKGETYEIKKISWHDVNAAQNPRVSPILVQNANGPCPLLALVNALTLSTPAEVETALVETLRSREQVSLGLLLDAVFDELMSGRRGDAAQELPDVSDLYKFLLTLHTGMNVNPRFFPNPPSKASNDPRNSMSHVHPSEREQGLPGTFEETREMKLYSTFSVPLIHGWLAEPDSPAYAALKRSANSYEDAQNLMFEEADLESKLSREGLSFEEQGRLEDIATIKAFFSSNATQLTTNGLATITTSIAPGGVAILFRNDHFSTLYRHPDTLQLLQLVTDMGYAGHEEVVWESLIDVNGENAEFFSGDFRLVGGAPPTPSTSVPRDSWTPVTGGRRESTQTGHRQNLSTSSHQSAPPPQTPNTEQEDHDFALAMQLQEEEEERERIEIARRRRETELSQQYIEQQGRGQQPSNNNSIPVTQRGGGNGSVRGRGRGSGVGGGGPAAENRPTIPPRRNNTGGRPVDPEAGIDAPPPSYEQAATQSAYNPPPEHPAHPSANPNPGHGPGGRRMSAYSANAVGQGQSPGGGAGGGRGMRRPTLVDQIPGRGGRGAGGGVGGVIGGEGGGGREREEKCVVM
ncbi:hypothetical protein ONS95_010731 [Cadophora gregata]|nr:uncharacterized protein ONS95_010731 [Cadophora gregata]KAK0122502.1 hypothetical protein ONS95_010731 [Cadophora gregata]KAK0127981.1 hypothetical protein ONS96_007475 [Cadophora gregata f. sp. sojae]